MELGQKTLVFSERIENLDEIFTEITFPDTIVFSSPIVESESASAYPIEETDEYYDFRIDLDSRYLQMSIMYGDNFWASADYRTSDGINYVKGFSDIMIDGEIIENTNTFQLPVAFSFESELGMISEIFQKKITNFGGLFYLDDVIDGTKMRTYTGETYILPYDIANDTDFLNKVSATLDNKILFMYNKNTHDMKAFDSKEYMIKDGYLYILNTGGGTAGSAVEYIHDSKVVNDGLSQSIPQAGKIIGKMSDIVIGITAGSDSWSQIYFLDSNWNKTHTFKDVQAFGIHKNLFKPYPVGIPTKSNKILLGNRVYTDEGIIEGTFGAPKTPEEFKELNDILTAASHSQPYSLAFAFRNNNEEIVPIVQHIDTSKCVSFRYMLENCPNLKSVDVSNFDMTGFNAVGNGNPITNSMDSMFSKDRNLIEVKGLVDMLNKTKDREEGLYVDSLLYGCVNVRCDDLDKIDGVKPWSANLMFSGCGNLTIDMSKFNWSDVHYLGYFASGDVATSQELPSPGPIVTNMAGLSFPELGTFDFMFKNNSNIEYIDMHNCNIPKAASLGSFALNCTNLKEVDFRNITLGTAGTPKDIARYAFKNCPNLIKFDATNSYMHVCNFCSMFEGDIKLKEVYVPTLDTSIGSKYANETQDISKMFSGCTSLEVIDIRNYDFTVITSSAKYQDAFTGVPANCLIIVKNDACRNWIKGKFSHLTNIKTVTEYEAA